MTPSQNIDSNFAEKAAQPQKQKPHKYRTTAKPRFNFLTGTKDCPLTYLPRIVYSLLWRGHSQRRIENEQGIHRAVSRRIIREILLPSGLVEKVGSKWQAKEPPRKWFTYTRKDSPAYLRVISLSRKPNGRTKGKWSVRLLYSFLLSQANANKTFHAPWRGRSYYARVLGVGRQSIKRAMQNLIGRRAVSRDGTKVIICNLQAQVGAHSDLVAEWCLHFWPDGYEQIMEWSDGVSLTTLNEKLLWVANNWNRDKYRNPTGLLQRVFKK